MSGSTLGWRWYPEGGVIHEIAGMGMGAEVLLQSAPPLQQPLSSAASGRHNLAFAILGKAVSVEVGNSTGSTHREQPCTADSVQSHFRVQDTLILPSLPQVSKSHNLVGLTWISQSWST